MTNNSETVSEYHLDFTRVLYMQYLEVDYAVRHADTKAQLILGINAVLVAALTSNIVRSDTLFVFEMVVVMCLLASLFFALLTVLPRFHPGEKEPNIFFFGDLVDIPREAYVEAYFGMPLQEVKKRIMMQIHIKSAIVNRKYKNVRVSVVFLLLALVAWALMWFSANLL